MGRLAAHRSSPAPPVFTSSSPSVVPTSTVSASPVIEFGETEQIFNDPKEEATKRYVSGNFG